MSNEGVSAVLFDLDGTIIDSYPGIQGAFDKAYKDVYKKANTVSIKRLIGPPIQKILFKVNGETDDDIISAFVVSYKEHYDTGEYKNAELYNGIKSLFNELENKGIKLFVATNKREKATELILNYFSIRHYFCRVYCPDSHTPNHLSKGDMVRRLLLDEVLDAARIFLIGDTSQDEAAAKENKVPFIWATYGYGNLPDIEKSIEKPLDALKFINNI